MHYCLLQWEKKPEIHCANFVFGDEVGISGLPSPDANESPIATIHRSLMFIVALPVSVKLLSDSICPLTVTEYTPYNTAAFY